MNTTHSELHSAKMKTLFIDNNIFTSSSSNKDCIEFKIQDRNYCTNHSNTCEVNVDSVSMPIPDKYRKFDRYCNKYGCTDNQGVNKYYCDRHYNRWLIWYNFKQGFKSFFTQGKPETNDIVLDTNLRSPYELGLYND